MPTADDPDDVLDRRRELKHKDGGWDDDEPDYGGEVVDEPE